MEKNKEKYKFKMENNRKIKKFSNELIALIKQRFQEAVIESKDIDLSISVTELETELVPSKEKANCFSPELIAQIASILELSLVTGTPYSFYFQQLRVEEDENKNWKPTPEYTSWYISTITSMSNKKEIMSNEPDA